MPINKYVYVRQMSPEESYWIANRDKGINFEEFVEKFDLTPRLSETTPKFYYGSMHIKDSNGLLKIVSESYCSSN